MLNNAPHITFNQEFVIPIYTLWDALMYTVGLKFYDLLAGRLSMGKSYFISRRKASERLPLLKSEGLKGGIVYHDGQFDDSRMAVALASACVENGGTVLNYFRVSGILKDEKGKIKGVRAEDVVSKEQYDIAGRVVINATGVFADSVSRLDNPDAPASIKPSQGIHLVLDRSFLQGNSAIMIPKTEDGRVLFAIPWYDKVVVGTTDTPLNEISMEPKALEQEIGFILRTASLYLKRAPERKDILSIYAGLRPLAADPDNPHATKEVSRRHKISVTDSGLVSIVGGKWTTYRRMAEEALDSAIKKGLIEKRQCNTDNLSLASDKSSTRLKIYGRGEKEIVKIFSDDPSAGRTLHPDLPYTRAEIEWICRNEMPVNIDDVLARRTRSILLNARASAEIAPVVADIMFMETGHDAEWKSIQLKNYNVLIDKYL